MSFLKYISGHLLNELKWRLDTVEPVLDLVPLLLAHLLEDSACTCEIISVHTLEKATEIFASHSRYLCSSETFTEDFSMVKSLLFLARVIIDLRVLRHPVLEKSKHLVAQGIIVGTTSTATLRATAHHWTRSCTRAHRRWSHWRRC